MKILITGHKGFVGRYFIEKYHDHDITGIDIKDGNDARDFFKQNDSSFDLVVHLAAIVGGRQTIEGSPISVAVDLSIDAEFFGWCLRAKPKHIVYFSSSAAYPIKYQYSNSGIKLSEKMIDLDDIQSPDLTYGWAKLTGEYLAKFVANEGINTTIFRPFSGYGTDQDLSYPFPSFIKRGLEKQNPFQIWGDGTQVRDFIHIRDIVEAVDICVQNNIIGTYNLGTGIPTCFNDLAKIIAKIGNFDLNIEHLPSAPTGVMYRVCDPAEMLKFYTPKISIEDGIFRALNNII
jgi:nucleoside-diphosphate-sugar epimerase